MRLQELAMNVPEARNLRVVFIKQVLRQDTIADFLRVINQLLQGSFLFLLGLLLTRCYFWPVVMLAADKDREVMHVPDFLVSHDTV